MTLEEKSLATILLGTFSILMIIARRYKNTDKDAGKAIAGWTIVMFISLWSL